MDDEEFNAMLEKHYPALVRRLTMVIHDADAAHDLVQETCARAIRARANFDGKNPYGWLSKIGLRLALNELRRRKTVDRHRRNFSSGGAEHIRVDPDLWDALGRLKRDHRAALMLTVVDGYSHSEAGEMLGVPPGTVASWVSRAKARLRMDLELVDESR